MHCLIHALIPISFPRVWKWFIVDLRTKNSIALWGQLSFSQPGSYTCNCISWYVPCVLWTILCTCTVDTFVLISPAYFVPRNVIEIFTVGAKFSFQSHVSIWNWFYTYRHLLTLFYLGVKVGQLFSGLILFVALITDVNIREATLKSMDNTLWPNDAIWHSRTWPTLVQLMGSCRMASSCYLNQWWLIICDVLWHSPGGIFTGYTRDICSRYELQNY